MDNQEFLKVISDSFKKFLSDSQQGKDASRNGGNDSKLSILHSAIAMDILLRIDPTGIEGYSVMALGVGSGKEAVIGGRYIDKKVDITILKNYKPIAGIAVKFVMQNYAQNSNNYFENMLGETANIRCTRIPYFQIFIIPDKMPYYTKKSTKLYNAGDISKWESFTEHNSIKYLKLSQDNTDTFIHTPDKTLLYVISLPDIKEDIRNKKEYVEYYSKFRNIAIKKSNAQYGNFSQAVIYNDYEIFAQKVAHRVLAM